jgi:LmbE family N-acetylglucosaminyl deacetylase
MVSVWAHPDDEAFGPSGLVRQLHDQGVRNVIITATRGEHGNLGEPPRATRHTLADIRTAELGAACEIMGVDRLELWSYPDGGLSVVDTNELRNRIGEILNQEKPHVVLTFGPDGVYGHPDHIAIHVAATQAFAQYLALHSHEEPPCLYYVTFAPDAVRSENSAGSDDAPDPLPATTRIDVSGYAEIKQRALQAHATQHLDWSKFLDRAEWFNTVYLHRAYPPAVTSDQLETALPL